MLADKIFAFLTGILIGRMVKGFFDFYDSGQAQKKNRAIGEFFEKEIIPVVNKVVRDCGCEDRIYTNVTCKNGVPTFELIFVFQVLNIPNTHHSAIILIKYIGNKDVFILTTTDSNLHTSTTTHNAVEIISIIKELVLYLICGFCTDKTFSPNYLESLYPNKQEPKQ